MATLALLLGLAAGYLLRGSQAPKPATGTSSISGAPPSDVRPMPTIEQMKRMADQQAEPLLAQLKKNPKDKDLLLRLAQFYKSAHQFNEAVSYLDKSLEMDPRNIAIRTEKASCLYYAGEVDGALATLHESLQFSPKDANTLFNLGVIRWKGKKDAPGAIAAWQQLLKTNPNHEKKAIVERMIAEARQPENQNSLGGANR
jgi:cytochrome c-type biogenesis protein CcmH/NrfG